MNADYDPIADPNMNTGYETGLNYLEDVAATSGPVSDDYLEHEGVPVGTVKSRGSQQRPLPQNVVR